MKNLISFKSNAIDVRTRVILTSVIPALIPWMAIAMYNLLPDTLTRIFIYTKGWLAWTLLEYSLHRWIMHQPKKRGEKKVNDFNHNHHHTHPRDIMLNQSHRIISMVVIFLSFITLWNGPLLLTYFGGFLAGAGGYVVMHWFLHMSLCARVFPGLARHHILHHCKFPDMCYGITSTHWDKLFKTIPDKGYKLSDKVIRFYYGNHHDESISLPKVA